MAKNTFELNPDQIREFHENGFLITDFGFDPNDIENAVADMEPLFENRRPDGTYRPGTRIQDGWKTSKAVHCLATNRNALTALGQLFGKKPVPFQTLNFPVGTEQKLHSDTVHFNSIPSGYMAGIWIALEDVSPINGSLVYYKGSHKLPEYNMQDFDLGTGYENYKHYETAIAELINANSFEQFHAELSKGQALIWHANLIHGGGKRQNPSTTRHSQVTHYYFEGCKYYTPMNSTPDDIEWRFPQWIPKKYKPVA